LNAVAGAKFHHCTSTASENDATASLIPDEFLLQVRDDSNTNT
jgi:hypothetical protein